MSLGAGVNIMLGLPDLMCKTKCALYLLDFYYTTILELLDFLA